MPQQLPKPVRNLGWISFFTDFASEVVYPVVPLFLTAALGAPVAVHGPHRGRGRGADQRACAGAAQGHGALGVFHMSLGFTALASSVVAGLLWDHAGPSAPFRLGGAVALTAVVAAATLAPRIRKAETVGREG
jgi:hypothetical protein